MILKKPYAFLIKHFRIIHIALVIPIFYLLYCTHNIIGFFRDYINSNYYTAISNIAGTYINYFMYFAILLILVIGIFIYFLMRKKEKSTKFYFFLIVFYVILLVILGITHGILSGMEIQTIEAAVARAYRDIAYIFYLPQFFFAAFTLFRGVGFDIKKFNFETDIKELEITDIDSEEFEFTLGIEDYKIKRNIRRFIREFKYYIKENKFIFIILCSIFTIIFGTIIYLNVDVYNKTYKQSQALSHNNLNIRVTGSMVTNRDYSGRIFNDKKYYLVLRLQIENRGRENKTLDYNNFFIQLENRRAYPILDRASYFIDFGETIRQDTELIPENSNSYVLAYELQEQEVSNEYQLMILEAMTYQVGEIAPQYKKVKLKPYQAINIENVKTTNLGKIATFEESNLGYSSYQIKEYDLKNNYTYQYDYCSSNNNCRKLTENISSNSSSKKLLILKGKSDIDQNTLYYKSARTERLFPDHFITIQYEDYNGEHIASIVNKTPSSFQDGYILEVPSELESASMINVLITIRNKRYVIKLK